MKEQDSSLTGLMSYTRWRPFTRKTNFRQIELKEKGTMQERSSFARLLPKGRKNSEAERNIRPMTIERSNSKSFGSHEGVEISAVYHTIIATCKAQAVSVCEYLKQFFTACVNGRTDYERSSLSRLLPTGRKNLTPMMLCQPVK